jgi:hypothetical protein
MEAIATGFWGSYFGSVGLMLAGSAFAWARGLRRIGINAALSALASALFVIAFLGWLPVGGEDTATRMLAHVATITSSLLAYMLLYMLGLLRQRHAARRRLARWPLGLLPCWWAAGCCRPARR